MAIDRIGAPAAPPTAPAREAPAAPARPFLSVLGEAARAAPPAAPPPARPPPPAEAALPLLLQGVLASEARIDAALEAARRGRTFSAAELLELQTRVFQYSQTVELLSRATDRVVGAVRQALSTQV